MLAKPGGPLRQDSHDLQCLKHMQSSETTKSWALQIQDRKIMQFNLSWIFLASLWFNSFLKIRGDFFYSFGYGTYILGDVLGHRMMVRLQNKHGFTSLDDLIDAHFLLKDYCSS